MPFNLVQKTYLNTELQALKKQENRLSEISSEVETILESFKEDDKDQDTVNDNGDSFVNAEVAKAAKKIISELNKEKKIFPSFDAANLDKASYEVKIIQVDTLINEEKNLKKSIKVDSEALHLLTKTTIEALSDKQVSTLLEAKWITPLLNELSQLPSNLIHQLTNQVQKLADKYAITYADVAKDIKHSEKALAGLVDELTGNEFDLQGLAELKAFLVGE
jgi:type I restriction enzyme M protein